MDNYGYGRQGYSGYRGNNGGYGGGSFSGNCYENDNSYFGGGGQSSRSFRDDRMDFGNQRGGFSNNAIMYGGAGYGGNAMYEGAGYAGNFDRGGTSGFGGGGGGGGYNFNETRRNEEGSFSSNPHAGGFHKNANNQVVPATLNRTKPNQTKPNRKNFFKNKPKESGLKIGQNPGQSGNMETGKTLEECLEEGSVIKVGRTRGARQIKYKCLHCKVDFVKDRHILKGGHRAHVKNCRDFKACFEGKAGNEGTEDDDEDSTEKIDDNEDNMEKIKDVNEKDNGEKLRNEFEELSNDGWILSPCDAFKFYSCLHCGERIQPEKLLVHIGGKHHQHHVRHCISDQKCMKKGSKTLGRKDRRFKKIYNESLEPVKYRCAIDGCDDKRNFTFDDFPEEALFPDNNFCTYFKPSFDNATGKCFIPTSFSSFQNESHLFSCPTGANFTFAKFAMDETVVTEFDMFCGSEFDKMKSSFIISVYILGTAVGSLVCGVLSDRHGRRTVLNAALFLTSAASLAGAFVPEYWSYLATRLLAGIGSIGCSILSFTMIIEMVGVEERVPFLPWVTYNTLLANLQAGIGMGVGQMVVPVVAVWARNWRQLEWIAAAGSFSFLICAALPESPRWLIAKGRFKQAEAVILAAAKANGSTISAENLVSTTASPMENYNNNNKEPSEKEAVSYGLKDLFDTSVRKSTLIMLFCWPVTNLVYIGLIRLSSNLSDDTTTNTIMSAAMEIPSSFAVILLMDVWGRKPLFSLTLIVSGMSSFVAAFMGKGTGLQIGLAMSGKFFLSASVNIIYQYTAELYPTAMRNTAFGVFSMFARVGGMAAPLVVVYLPKVLPELEWFPLTLIGSLTILGGSLALLLPETLGFPLPETFENIEEIKRNPKPFWTLVIPRSGARENNDVVKVESHGPSQNSVFSVNL